MIYFTIALHVLIFTNYIKVIKIDNLKYQTK